MYSNAVRTQDCCTPAGGEISINSGIYLITHYLHNASKTGFDNRRVSILCKLTVQFLSGNVFCMNRNIEWRSTDCLQNETIIYKLKLLFLCFLGLWMT